MLFNPLTQDVRLSRIDNRVCKQKVASQICGWSGKARVVKADVADFVAVEQLIQETVERTGHLDYIFNHAGIGIGVNVKHFSIEDWNQNESISPFSIRERQRAVSEII